MFITCFFMLATKAAGCRLWGGVGCLLLPCCTRSRGKRFQGMRLALSNNDYAFVRAGSMPLSIGRLRLPYAMMH